MRRINNSPKDQALILQFAGDETVISEKLGLNSIGYYYANPLNNIIQTGLFGMIDALINLGLSGEEIADFYVYGHVEPYNDPYRFTYGIIEIAQGLPLDEIKNKYGRFLNSKKIIKYAKKNLNTQMLLSFCYDKDDYYVFISDPKDLYNRFYEGFQNRYEIDADFTCDKEFPKIDGPLFRAVRFIVKCGYQFPNLESLFDEQIEDLIFKQSDSKHIFILNKAYARKMSNDLLALVYFSQMHDCKILSPEYIFDPKERYITLTYLNGKQIKLDKSYLEENVIKYDELLCDLNHREFKVSDIMGFCDKRVKSIILKCTDSAGNEHSISVKREALLSIDSYTLKIIEVGFNLGFTFPDNDNLFATEEKMLQVIDPSGQKRFVFRKTFANSLTIIVLLKKEGYTFADYTSLFDESNPYITVNDKQNQERIISRKQINKIIRLKNLLYSEQETLTESDKDLLAMFNNYSIRPKLFEWLSYTAKKWIPSSAVISKIPAERSYEYFYNNNHARLGVLKDYYQAKSYDDMEGIVSLGYILGLFDSKESTSKKALDYIIKYFLEKGISADELHTTYGAIDLRSGYNKKFADFFMQHYAIDKNAFIEPDLGTNMTGELFGRFAEVLEKRPEKRIKTNTKNKLLLPRDAMAVITDVQIDSEILGEKTGDERYIHLFKLLSKFGASKDEIKWAIGLYEEALLIDEKKVLIPHIEDLKTSLMMFTSHLKSDPQAFLSGRKTNCCSRYGGYAEDRLTHVITDPAWRYVTFSSFNGTFFDGLVWYDSEDKVVCIDNVEGQFSKLDGKSNHSVEQMADTIIRYADGIYVKMNELAIPCTKVNVGNDPGTASYEIFKYAKGQGLILDDSSPCRYPARNEISTDATRQFTITDDSILKLRRKL